MVELGLVGIDVDDDTGPARNGVEFLNVALRDREMDEVDINTALGGEAFKLLFERRGVAQGAVEVAKVIDDVCSIIVDTRLDRLEAKVSLEKPRATISGTS
jgi:hypothetical protein